MKEVEKSLRRYAKYLVELSLDQGQVSPERVSAILKLVQEKTGRRAKPILKAYKNYLRREIANSQVNIGFTKGTNPAVLQQIQTKLEEHYKRSLQVNSAESDTLIAGVRASVGDDIWEDSVSQRLYQLASSI